MEKEIVEENNFSFRNIKYGFDKLTSNNGKSWLLALNWILFLEFFSSIIEYHFLDISRNYIEYIPEGVYKELSIALMIVFFIWYSIYNFITFEKKTFFIFSLYISICLYLLITRDISFNLLIHNLNIFEILENGFSFYLIVQLLLKFIILYLIFKMFTSYKYKDID